MSLSNSTSKNTGSSPLSFEMVAIRKELDLTFGETLKLCRFSPAIIRRIYDQLETNLPHDASSLWAYLIGMDACSKQKIDPDYGWSDKLIEYAKEQHSRGIPTPPATWTNPDLKDFNPDAPHVFTTIYHIDGRITKNWTYDPLNGYQKTKH